MLVVNNDIIHIKVSDNKPNIKVYNRVLSNYDLAKLNGFEGNITDWLNSLKGDDGIGLPEGGTQGQVLVKNSAADYDFKWVDPTGGGGGAIEVTSVASNFTGTNPISTYAPFTKAVTSTKKYRVTIMGRWRVSNTAHIPTLNIVTPGGTVWGRLEYLQSSGGFTFSFVGNTGTTACNFQTGGLSSANSDLFFKFDLIYECSTSGNLEFRFGSNSGVSSPQVTTIAGTRLYFEEFD